MRPRRVSLPLTTCCFSPTWGPCSFFYCSPFPTETMLLPELRSTILALLLVSLPMSFHHPSFACCTTNDDVLASANAHIVLSFSMPHSPRVQLMLTMQCQSPHCTSPSFFVSLSPTCTADDYESEREGGAARRRCQQLARQEQDDARPPAKAPRHQVCCLAARSNPVVACLAHSRTVVCVSLFFVQVVVASCQKRNSISPLVPSFLCVSTPGSTAPGNV